MDQNAAKRLFDGWEEATLQSCLQGHTGALCVEGEAPRSAMVNVGSFSYLAGEPDAALLKRVDSLNHRMDLLVPKDAAWEPLIESYYGARAKKFLRYAIKREPDVFDRQKLAGFVAALDPRYELKLFDEQVFDLARSEAWSADLCARFQDYVDYKARAVGAAVLYQGKLAAGASPYAVYDGGIEIEIDTKAEHRGRGLATACGARLILECLDRGLYPNWDAHDLRSVALAEKLGYHRAHPYVAYEISDGLNLTYKS